MESNAERPSPRWRRRPKERPKQIMEAALGAFSSKGFAATTLDEIAARAGLTKGTIYLYFADKEALFIETLRWKMTSAFPDLGALQMASSVDELVRRVVDSALLLFHEPEFLRMVALLIGEAKRFPDLGRRYYREVILVLNHAVAGGLRGLAARGKLRGDLDFLIAGRALVGMVLVFALSQEVLRGKEVLPISEADIARNVVALALDGLRLR